MKALVAVKLDVAAAQLSDEKVVIGEGVGFQPSTYWGAFSVAEIGACCHPLALPIRWPAAISPMSVGFARHMHVTGQTGNRIQQVGDAGHAPCRT